MVWNIKAIPPQKAGLDSYPVLLKFLIGRGSFEVENLDVLQNANLEIELEGASNGQKLLIYAAIKFHLNHSYENNQSAKFEELNMIGISFEQLMNAPDIRLGIDNRTQCNIFKNYIFDAILHRSWIFNGDDSNGWLLECIDYSQKGFLDLSEKTFLSAIICLEPELIEELITGLGEKMFDISVEVMNRAAQNIMQVEYAYFASLINLNKIFGTEKEINACEVPQEIARTINTIPEPLLEFVLQVVQKSNFLYYDIEAPEYNLPQDILNLIMNKLEPHDAIQIIKYAEPYYSSEGNLHQDVGNALLGLDRMCDL